MTDRTTLDPMDTTTVLAAGALNRRRFLMGTGAAGLALVAAACGSDDEDAETGASTPEGGDDTTTTAEEGGGGGEGDLAVARAAAGLEVLAVNTYQAALDAATAGKLGTVPPAVAEYVQTALAHHQEHLSAWNAVLSGAGEDEVTAPPSDLEATVNEQFAQVTDVGGAAELALMLEEIAAATYVKAVPTIEGTDARSTAASIVVIDRQHISVLLFALGQYPVPEVFASTEQAVI